METCDDEFVEAATDFIKRQERAGKPVRVAQHDHMHASRTRRRRASAKPAAGSRPTTTRSTTTRTSVRCKRLDDLRIADDTFVQYSTDNGPHRNSWPDGTPTPFRSEKNTNWEGAFRIR
jgi:arylsulfatase